jgi:hypothetical protein
LVEVLVSLPDPPPHRQNQPLPPESFPPETLPAGSFTEDSELDVAVLSVQVLEVQVVLDAGGSDDRAALVVQSQQQKLVW